jgi:hypothetical protein
MMIALFKVSVNLDGGAKHFHIGEHVLDNDTAKNDYVQLLIGDGLIEVLKDDTDVLEAVVVDEAPAEIEAPKKAPKNKV